MNELQAAQLASLELLNELRVGMGLSPLQYATDLNDFATNWSYHMSDNVFEHSPREDRIALLDGINRTLVGENIAFTSNTSLSPEAAAARLHNLWVNSPGHYANMTRSNYTSVGIGFWNGPGGWYATHVFYFN